jgi:hypothetical protein
MRGDYTCTQQTHKSHVAIFDERQETSGGRHVGNIVECYVRALHALRYADVVKGLLFVV